jgi:hypothetical protein
LSLGKISPTLPHPFCLAKSAVQIAPPPPSLFCPLINHLSAVMAATVRTGPSYTWFWLAAAAAAEHTPGQSKGTSGSMLLLLS